MKILFAGGGTGGHFYPLIAVHRALRKIAEQERILSIEVTLLSDTPYDADLLRQENISFSSIPAGKVRRYWSIKNIFDPLKTAMGIMKAILRIFLTLPDVIFAKGGYASFPALFAGRLFRIPIIIHESDTVPGRVNMWASSFARRIAVSFPEAAHHFPQEKVALTGHPIRQTITGGNREEAFQTFNLEKETPVMLVMGGSQGAVRINNAIVDMLPNILDHVQIVHQTGRDHFETVSQQASTVLEKSPNKSRYHPAPFLNESQLRSLSQVTTLAVSRAGAGSIFMFAAWKTPALLIPITESAQNHQRKNAYSYARTGAATVIEESNLTPNLLSSEIQNILSHQDIQKKMQQAAGNFAKVDAAEKIAQEIITLALEHAS